MIYKTILVDDEPLALTRLRRLLDPYAGRIDIVGTADNGADAVALINRIRPDLVFLDIQMPELNGFDVLERLDYTPLVIFSTAYDQYALRAFEVNSIDYLLKPVDPVRLEKAINKLMRLSDAAAGDLRDRIARMLESVPGAASHRIQIRLGDKIKLIPVSEITFFRASDKYVEVHSQGRVHLITKSLSQLESELPSDDFVRVHRSIIVNVNFVEEFAKDFGGGYVVRMNDPGRTTLPVSRRYKSRLNLR
ncbi:MAG: response regulator transcription factor [Candidatus Latescibacterota bacterium]|nr:MAG: response regulator transcription factor [Candidatus Latescibacterota bacterium]